MHSYYSQFARAAFCAAAMALMLSGLASPCAQGAEKEGQAKTPSAQKKTNVEGLKKFLHSTVGTHGWKPVKGTTSYDFFPDGRVHIQGPDGEASMAEGRWSLAGDRLTIIQTERKSKITMAVERDGEDLLLAEQRYRRYRP